MADLAFYQSQADYDVISSYLELDPIGFVPKFDLPKFQPNYDHCLIVDGTPVTTSDKASKLLAALHKIFVQFSSSLQMEDIELPLNENGNTCGFCFVKFQSKAEAELALQTVQGFAMGKSIFRISSYADFEKYLSINEEFVPSTPAPFKPRLDPTEYLCDNLGRDQFAIRYAKETEVYWANTTAEDPTPIYCGEREKSTGKTWCENKIAWSPQGTYLATFHPPGIKLWGSNQFTAEGRFLHAGVDSIEFSPCENYLTTYRLNANTTGLADQAIVIWNVLDGTAIRNFALKNPLEAKFQVKATVDVKTKDNKSTVEKVIRGRIVSYTPDSNEGYFTIEEGNDKYERVPFNKVEPLQEPNKFKWSSDGKYIARIGADIIQVYTLPDMTLLNQKSIPTKDVVDFAWSPKVNVISYWCPAAGNHPATINLIEIPSKKDISSRKFFDVVDGKMIWQNNGDYLCVKMQNKKRINMLVFFRINESGVPVEQLEFTEHIQSISWEPFGDRFVVVLGERNPTIQFYSMAGTASGSTTKKEITLLFSLTGIQCSETIWSPAGSIIALACFAGDSCNFQLHDVDNNIKLASKVHNRCNRLYWDPSGRLLASCVITDLRNMNSHGHPEDGYNIYTFQGNQLVGVKRDKLFFFLWRPRPKDILSQEAKKLIVKNLKRYEKIFEREDRLRIEELNKEILMQRRKQAEDFFLVVQRNRLANAPMRQNRIRCRNGYDSDDDNNYRVEIQVTETILETITK